MDLEQKKRRILDASRKFSKRKLDPKGKGKDIKKLEDGKSVTEAKINEIYNQVLKLESEQRSKQKDKQIPKQTRQKDKQIPEQSHLIEIEAKLERLENRINFLEWEFRQYKQSSQPVFANKREPKQEQSLYGFSIKRTTTKSEGKIYQVYKAFRSINGTGLHVYIGQDITKAREKIIAYLKKNRKKLAHVLPVVLKEQPRILE